MAFIQLDPPIPVHVTDRGPGMAFAVIDYGPEFDLLWVTGMDDGGQLKARARIASQAGKRDEAITLLREAAAIDLRLAYNEPRDIFMPVTHVLGAELIAAGKPGEAEAVYRDDLKRFPNDGWALFGLAKALGAEGKASEAAAAQAAFDRAWPRADVKLAASAF